MPPFGFLKFTKPASLNFLIVFLDKGIYANLCRRHALIFHYCILRQLTAMVEPTHIKGSKQLYIQSKRSSTEPINKLLCNIALHTTLSLNI